MSKETQQHSKEKVKEMTDRLHGPPERVSRQERLKWLTLTLTPILTLALALALTLTRGRSTSSG